MNIETLHLDEDAKRRLTSLKRRTGISQWNILSRWAFCTSLASGHVVGALKNAPLSSVEMTWKVFSGQNGKAYEALALQSHSLAAKTGFAGSLHDIVSEHIGYGASILVAGKTSIRDCKSLLSRAAIE